MTMVAGTVAIKNARQVLIQLYRKTLEDVKELPLTAAYRQNVEGITRYPLSLCESTHSHREIEMACEQGRIEEILEQAIHPIHSGNGMKNKAAINF